MNLNFLADFDLSSLSKLRALLLRRNELIILSVELARGNHFLPSSICSPAIPVKWGWHSPRNMFSKRTQGIASSVSYNLVPCFFLKVGFIKKTKSCLFGGLGQGNSSIHWASKWVTEVCRGNIFPLIKSYTTEMWSERSWVQSKMRGRYVSEHLRKRRRKTSRTNRVLLVPEKTSGCWRRVLHPMQVGPFWVLTGVRQWLVQACLFQGSGPIFLTSICWVCSPLSSLPHPLLLILGTIQTF